MGRKTDFPSRRSTAILAASRVSLQPATSASSQATSWATTFIFDQEVPIADQLQLQPECFVGLEQGNGHWQNHWQTCWQKGACKGNLENGTSAIKGNLEKGTSAIGLGVWLVAVIDNHTFCHKVACVVWICRCKTKNIVHAHTHVYMQTYLLIFLYRLIR